VAIVLCCHAPDFAAGNNEVDFEGRFTADMLSPSLTRPDGICGLTLKIPQRRDRKRQKGNLNDFGRW